LNFTVNHNNNINDKDVIKSIQATPVVSRAPTNINTSIEGLNDIAFPKPKPQPKAEPRQVV
jgi:hypothetical protein